MTETGWVIEKASSPMGLGVVCGRLKWVTFDEAIRFARREDAEKVMGLLDDKEGAKAVEHGWADFLKADLKIEEGRS